MSVTTESAPPEVDLTAGRRQVARSRGALSGVLLIILGAWAALAPFIGPYFDFQLTPRPDDAWHWTSGRGLYEVLPGGVAVLAGLVLLLSASRLLTLTMAWLAVLSGAWLVIAPTLAFKIGIAAGRPDALDGSDKYIGVMLAFFLALGAGIVLVAGAALGRLSVHSVRDVRAAEHRAAHQAAEAAEAERIEAERAAAVRAAQDEQQRHDAEARENPAVPSAAAHDEETRTNRTVYDTDTSAFVRPADTALHPDTSQTAATPVDPQPEASEPAVDDPARGTTTGFPPAAEPGTPPYSRGETITSPEPAPTPESAPTSDATHEIPIPPVQRYEPGRTDVGADPAELTDPGERTDHDAGGQPHNPRDPRDSRYDP